METGNCCLKGKLLNFQVVFLPNFTILFLNSKRVCFNFSFDQESSGLSTMAWNVFKFCTALRALGSIMILFVIGIIGFTYYALVLVNYGPSLLLGGLDSFIALLVLALFHFLVSQKSCSFLWDLLRSLRLALFLVLF